MDKRMYLISRYNTENYGDLAIAHQILDEYSSKYEVVPISIFGDLYKHCNIDSVLFSKHLSISRIKKQIEMLQLYQNVRPTDAFVFAGGNMMCDVTITSKSSKKYKPFVEIAQKKGCKMVALSIGFGPFKTKEQEISAREILDNCEYITFRDDNSLQRYIGLGGICQNVKLSVDTGFFYFPFRCDNEILQTVGINIINPDILGEDEKTCQRIAESYKKIIEKIMYQGDKVVLFVTDKTDIPFLNKIKSELGAQKKLKYCIPNGLGELHNIFLGIDVLIGARMHSMILGYSTGLPVIGVSWQDKITDLFEMLGYEERCFEMGLLESQCDMIVALYNNIKNNYPEELRKIKQNYSMLRQRKKVNEEYIKIVMN